jgi:hypothetical protein
MVLSTSFHWHGPSILKFEPVIGIANGQTGIILEGLEEGVHCDVIVEDGIRIWINSRFHKCIIFWGLETHIAPLLGDVKAIKMIVLRSAISIALVCAEITVTECVTRARDKQLAVATMAAAIMVVHVVGAFFECSCCCCSCLLGSLGSDGTCCRNACC